MKKRLMTVFLAICMLLACAGCAKNADSKIQTKSSTSAKKAEITVAGSTAFEPLVKQAVKSYAQFNPSVKVNVLGGGSQAGLNQVDQGKVEIGTSDFFAAQQNIVNRDHLSDYKVAVVGIAVVANQKLKVNNLSASQLKDIFSGKITNWKQVGGKNQKITIVSRADGSGSRKAFELNVMGKTPIAAAEELSSNKHLEEYVAKTPGAIGYQNSRKSKSTTLRRLRNTSRTIRGKSGPTNTCIRAGCRAAKLPSSSPICLEKTFRTECCKRPATSASTIWKSKKTNTVQWLKPETSLQQN